MKKALIASLLLMSATAVASQLRFTAETTLANCQEGVGGTLTITVSGGIPGYLVQVSEQQDQFGNGPVFVFGPLEARQYDITVTDSEEEPQRVSQDVTVSASDLDIDILITPQNCVLGTFGRIVVTASGGTPDYTVNVTEQPPQTGPGPVFTFDGLPDGNYVVNLIDEVPCARVRNVAVPISNLSFTTEVALDDCDENSLGSITVTVQGGNPDYLVTVSGQTPQMGTGPFVFDGLEAGDYDVTVTDSGATGVTPCSRSDVVAVPGPLAFTTIIIPENCEEDERGALEITVTGGFPDYTVDVSNQAAKSGPGPLFEFLNLVAGEYDIEVTDSDTENGNCEREDTVTLPFSDLALEVETTPQSFENNELGSITVDVSGGDTPYTVTIESAETEDSKVGNGPTFVFGGLKANSYIVTVTDSFDCSRKVCAFVLSDNDILNFIIKTECAIC